MFYGSSDGALNGKIKPAYLDLSSAGSSQWITSGSNIFFTGASVGIGTASPSASYKLDVTGAGHYTSNLVVDGAMGIGTSPTSGYTLDMFATSAKLRIRDLGQTNGLELYQNNADGGNNIFAVNNNYLAMGTNNTERMRINSNGNVGIGTSTPSTSYKLDVA